MPKVTVTCQECGKEFEVLPYQIKDGIGKYCSRKCAGNARSRIFVGQNNPTWKPKIKRICKFCGKEFEITPSKIRGNRGFYCGKICYYQDRSRRFSGENNPSFKEKILRKCQRCGKEFPVIPSRVEKGFGKYCSKKCFYGEKIKRICRFCGKEFEKRRSELNGQIKAGSYCCKECQSKDRIYQFGGGEKNQIELKIKRKCLKCGKEFEISPYVIRRGQGRGKYCSRECKEEDQLAEKHPSWKGGISFEPYCPKFNNKFRERVRKWFDYQCLECGQPQNERKLQIHHVYYNKKACCEQNENGEYIYNIDDEQVKVIGDPNKFVALCNSCHIKTNSNRLYWARYFENIINNWYEGRSWADE